MNNSTDRRQRLIALGIISGAHGIRGQVKVRSFTDDPEDILSYGPLRDAGGKEYKLTITGRTADALIVSVAGVSDRNAAETLRNTELFVPRAALPAPRHDEYYHEDLVGLALVTENAEPYGSITAVHNFGAGDLVGIKRISGAEEMLPFAKKTFPRIDFEKGSAIIIPPETIVADGENDDRGDDE